MILITVDPRGSQELRLSGAGPEIPVDLVHSLNVTLVAVEEINVTICEREPVLGTANQVTPIP